MPRQFHSGVQELTFTCKSYPPMFPLKWYVFTDDGILVSDEAWNSSWPVSINIVSSYVYGNSTLTITQENYNCRKVVFVVCSTSVGEGGRTPNAISRAVSEEMDVGSTLAVPVSDKLQMLSSFTLIPSPVPFTCATGTADKPYQTERVLFLITVGFLFVLDLGLICCLVKTVLLPKMKSKQAEGSSASSFQPNPAYISYDGNSSICGNDVH